MKITHFLIIFLVFVSMVFSQSKFDNLIDPQFIHLTAERLIIADQTTIYIYSAKDNKLLKSFGRQGSGPEEFLPLPGGRWIIPTVQKDFIFIESLGKVSYFQSDGIFEKEVATGQNGFGFKGIQNKMVAMKRIVDGNRLYSSYQLFDDKVKPFRELYRQENQVRRGREIHLLKGSNLIDVSDNLIFLASGEKMEVKIFDVQGKLIDNIKHEYPNPRKVTEKDIKGVHKFMKQKYPGGYQNIKNLIRLPDTFPVLRSRVGLKYDYNQGKEMLYLLTWKQNKGRFEFYIFSTKGKLINKVFLPLVSKDFVQPYPFTFRNNRLYQLVFDEDTEEYQLHSHPVQ